MIFRKKKKVRPDTELVKTLYEWVKIHEPEVELEPEEGYHYMTFTYVPTPPAEAVLVKVDGTYKTAYVNEDSLWADDKVCKMLYEFLDILHTKQYREERNQRKDRIKSIVFAHDWKKQVATAPDLVCSKCGLLDETDEVKNSNCRGYKV